MNGNLRSNNQIENPPIRFNSKNSKISSTTETLRSEEEHDLNKGHNFKLTLGKIERRKEERKSWNPSSVICGFGSIRFNPIYLNFNGVNKNILTRSRERKDECCREREKRLFGCKKKKKKICLCIYMPFMYYIKKEVFYYSTRYVRKCGVSFFRFSIFITRTFFLLLLPK